MNEMFLINEKDNNFPTSIYKNHTVNLTEIKLENIEIKNNKLNVKGYFKLSSSSFRFKSFKLWIYINNIKIELLQVLNTNLLNLKKSNSKTKQSFQDNILNNNYSTTKDNEKDIISEFIFNNIDLNEDLRSIRIEIEYFYNLFYKERVIGYQNFLIENNWNLLVTNYAEEELKEELKKINIGKSYFSNNSLDDFTLEYILDNSETRLEYKKEGDLLLNDKIVYNFFYKNDVGDIFYDYESGRTLIIKIDRNKINGINLNDKSCFYNLYDRNKRLLDTNFKLNLSDNVEIKIKGVKWCNSFLKEIKNLNLDNLKKYFNSKKVYNFGNKRLKIKIDNLSELENCKFIANDGNKMGKLEIKYLDSFINLDFSNLDEKNLGLNVESFEKFVVKFKMIFNGCIGNIEISPINIPCFTETCYILTPDGYTNITKLKKGDLIKTADNRNVNITNIFTTKITKELEKPYVIKADQYGENKPMLDTYISRKHQYKLNGKWTSPEKENLKQKINDKNLTYYHIETPKYLKDNLMVNGIEMESWDGIVLN